MLLHFHQRSGVFIAFWRGRFWCETGAVRERSRAVSFGKPGIGVPRAKFAE
jgi:hypothetical protein